MDSLLNNVHRIHSLLSLYKTGETWWTGFTLHRLILIFIFRKKVPSHDSYKFSKRTKAVVHVIHVRKRTDIIFPPWLSVKCQVVFTGRSNVKYCLSCFITSGGAKVSFILRHRGAQLILAYSWARPAILVAGKGRGGCFYFFCFFTHSCSSYFPVPLFHLLYYLFYLFSPFLWETTQNDPQGLTCR